MNCIEWKSLSCVPFFYDPMTTQSKKCSRPGYWGGSLSPSLVIFLTQESNFRVSCTAGGLSYQLELSGKIISGALQKKKTHLLRAYGILANVNESESFTPQGSNSFRPAVISYKRKSSARKGQSGMILNSWTWQNNHCVVMESHSVYLSLSCCHCVRFSPS